MARRVGRPEVGPAFSVRFPDELLDRIDAVAASTAVSRASWLRGAAEERLAYPRSALATLAEWMVNQGMAGDISYALERADKHTDLLYCALHGIPGELYDDLVADRQHALRHDDVLPAGWAVSPTTPVDFTVTCPHGSVVEDTEADRAHTSPTMCLEGCRDHYRRELQANLTGRQPVTPDTAGAAVHQLRPSRGRRR